MKKLVLLFIFVLFFVNIIPVRAESPNVTVKQVVSGQVVMISVSKCEWNKNGWHPVLMMASCQLELESGLKEFAERFKDYQIKAIIPVINSTVGGAITAGLILMIEKKHLTN